jgi:FkbM family methyltransferase
MGTLTFSADDVRACYGALQDDLSRDIFNARLSAFLNDDTELLFGLTKWHFARGAFDAEFEMLKKHKQNGKSIIFYGAGSVAHAAAKYARNYGISPDLFCDRSAVKQARGFLGKRCISQAELRERYSGAVVCVAVSRVYAAEIKEELADAGMAVYDFFVNYETDGYFDHIKPRNDEIYVDCGLLNGQTVIDFAKWAGAYRKVYGFEPDPRSFERTSANLKDFANIVLIPKGVWNCAATLEFDATGDGGAHITDEIQGGTGMLYAVEADKSSKITVDVTSIDEVLRGDACTLIKMDIEGAELEALRGADKTIRRWKPRLIICVYHKPQDILELPLYIHSLVPEYKFTLRHNSIGFGGTVLYASCGEA